MRDRAADVGHSTSERARQAGHGVAEQAGRAQNAIAQVMREQPLIVGAVGLTIGAIIGASLPRSRKEDEVMGEASDSICRFHPVHQTDYGAWRRALPPMT